MGQLYCPCHCPFLVWTVIDPSLPIALGCLYAPPGPGPGPPKKGAAAAEGNAQLISEG